MTELNNSFQFFFISKRVKKLLVALYLTEIYYFVLKKYLPIEKITRFEIIKVLKNSITSKYIINP